MRMASSSFLSLSVLVLLFSISSANTRKSSLPNGLDQNPTRMIESAVGDSKETFKHMMAAKSLDQSGKSQTLSVGTWGAQAAGSNGLAFDDGVYTGIREISFEYNKETAIGSFQVTYDLNGAPFVAKKHPSFITGFTQVKISLDFPKEYIVEVSGSTDNVQGYIVVRSLKFKTNKATYGPYGTTSGTSFSLPLQSGLIIGVKGSVGYWLDYIGFHLSH